MEDFRQLLEYLFTPSAPVFIVGGLIVLLLPVLVHLLVVRATPYTSLPSILLVGPAGSGKTALLALLERGDDGTASTHTSQIPHSVELTISTADDGKHLNYREAARDDAPGTHKKFLLTDTPGHGKLRNVAMGPILASVEKAKNKSTGSDNGGREGKNLRGIVFVVDAAALDETLAVTAEYLYDVLLSLQKRMGKGKTSRAPSAVPVLIAANKTDLFTALPASLVRSKLEAELGRIRQSRSKGLLDSSVNVDDGIGNDGEMDDWLGEYGAEKFMFGQMKEFDLEVDVMAGSVITGDVDTWWAWISNRI